MSSGSIISYTGKSLIQGEPDIQISFQTGVYSAKWKAKTQIERGLGSRVDVLALEFHTFQLFSHNICFVESGIIMQQSQSSRPSSLLSIIVEFLNLR